MVEPLKDYFIDYFSVVPTLPSKAIEIGLDLGFSRKEIQLILQKGLDAGYWHLNCKMEYEEGSLY